MQTVQPDWPRPTHQHHKQRVAQFSANLKAVASSIASHEGLDATSVIHVDEAHLALAKAGLCRKKWYLRPEFEVGAGALLFGIALSSFSIGPFVFPKNPDHAFVLTVILLCVGAVTGIFLSIQGWMRGNLPHPPPKDFRRRWWLCWPWSSCTLHCQDQPSQNCDHQQNAS
jgi:hypothetical protein